MIKPLDIVTIDSGAVGVVTETDGRRCNVRWFANAHTINAWWEKGIGGFKVIDSLPAILADALRAKSNSINPYRDDRKLKDAPVRFPIL